MTLPTHNRRTSADAGRRKGGSDKACVWPSRSERAKAKRVQGGLHSLMRKEEERKRKVGKCMKGQYRAVPRERKRKSEDGRHENDIVERLPLLLKTRSAL